MRFYSSMLLALAILGTSIPAVAQEQSKEDQFGVFDIPVDDRSFGELDELGVGWVREQFRLGEVAISVGLPFYSRIISGGQGLFLTIYHRDADNIKEEDRQSFEESTRGAYPPDDSVRYKNLVGEFVNTLAGEIERLNKDPEDFLIIQFCNEVMPTDILPDNATRFWHGSQDEYMETLKWTFNAIKEQVSHNIPVANAGISSAVMEEIMKYERDPSAVDPVVEEIYAFNDRMLKQGTYDWADVHLRHDVNTIADKINWVKQRWTGPLAATEFAGPDERTGLTYSENLQAEELVQRMDIAVANGVDRIFWSHLVENPAVDAIYFKEGLIEHLSWKRKPAFFAYRDYISDEITGVEKTVSPILNVFPSPFTNYLLFEFDGAPLKREFSIQIFNSSGILVDSFIPDEPNDRKLKYDTKHLKSGIYYIKVDMPGHSLFLRKNP